MAGAHGRIIVIRHGETAWSSSGRHTGLTDVPLTDAGRERAVRLAPAIARRSFGLVLASPLRRAHDTAALAGLTAAKEPELVERRYGPVEGLTTTEVRTGTGDPTWDVWGADLSLPLGIAAPPDAYAGPAESLDDVAARLRPLLARCLAVTVAGQDCVLVAHGHVLRILAALWLDLTPDCGRHLLLDAAHVGVLGFERDTPALLGWNLDTLPPAHHG